jgi:ABC-type Zn uptake system ZnuABC Zn-binding protein ZnuA
VLAVVPDAQRQLVTGHGALGYFADRYGFRIVGTVIPGLSSSDEPSARDIAELIESIREAGTTALFSDVGTPPSVAEAVAAEAGAQLVELRVAQLPESGRYADLLRDIATAVAGALGA